MGTTQIPRITPPQPPRTPLEDSNGGHDSNRRSEIGRLEAPALLIQLQDDLARSRLREAFWISLLVHVLMVVGLVTSPRFLPRRAFLLGTPGDLMRNKELTYLEMPPDLQKNVPRPNSNIISDKNRIAASRNPTLDRKALRQILDSARPGAPGSGGIPAPKPQPATPPLPAASAQAAAGAQAQNAAPPAATSEQNSAQQSQIAKLEPPRVAKPQPFGGALSPGASIEAAARAAAASRDAGYGGSAGDYGAGIGNARSRVHSDIDVVSDTMGVDFGPYLSRVLHDVRLNWYNLIPEVARAPLMKKGKVSVEFAILKDGHVAGMRLISPSGDVSLDRAAMGGITGSNPFPPLPGEFRGQYLALRFHFFYNPDRNELQ
jgi:TonB family protein